MSKNWIEHTISQSASINIWKIYLPTIFQATSPHSVFFMFFHHRSDKTVPLSICFLVPLVQTLSQCRNGEKIMVKKRQEKYNYHQDISTIQLISYQIRWILPAYTGLEVIHQDVLTPETDSFQRHVETKACTNSHAWTGRNLNCKDQWSSTVHWKILKSLSKRLWGKWTSNTFINFSADFLIQL